MSHEQNLILADVRQAGLHPLWQEARALGLATPNIGLLTNGSGMTQSSLLAGGTQLGVVTSPPNLTLGMVAQGGSALPQGVQLNLTFQAV